MSWETIAWLLCVLGLLLGWGALKLSNYTINDSVYYQKLPGWKISFYIISVICGVVVAVSLIGAPLVYYVSKHNRAKHQARVERCESLGGTYLQITRGVFVPVPRQRNRGPLWLCIKNGKLLEEFYH